MFKIVIIFFSVLSSSAIPPSFGCAEGKGENPVSSTTATPSPAPLAFHKEPTSPPPLSPTSALTDAIKLQQKKTKEQKEQEAKKAEEEAKKAEEEARRLAIAEIQSRKSSQVNKSNPQLSSEPTKNGEESD